MTARLRKGVEVELFLGSRDGALLPLADLACQASADVVLEMDARQIEYRTPAEFDAVALRRALYRPRVHLRRHLSTLGGYTLLPGSTPFLPFEPDFSPALPDQPRTQKMGQAYGSRVLACGVHLHLNVPSLDRLFPVFNGLRLEAYMFLALTASSPYRGGVATGYHSTRWHLLPQEPAEMPFFDDIEAHGRFLNQAEAAGRLHDARHAWMPVRLSGRRRPDEVNRVELRICDMVYDPDVIVALADFLEARIHCLSDRRGPQEPALLAIAAENEQRAAARSLEATVWHGGREVPIRDAIRDAMREAETPMRTLGTLASLDRLERVLAEGNEAMRFLGRVDRTGDLRRAYADAMAEAEAIDATFTLPAGW